MIERVVEVARVVRAVAEGRAQECGRDVSLVGWCGVVSAALVEVYWRAGVRATIAGGYVQHVGHYWVAVEVVHAERWENRCAFVDLTATQFPELQLPPVTVLEPGDARREWYALEEEEYDLSLGPLSWGHFDAIVEVASAALGLASRAERVA